MTIDYTDTINEAINYIMANINEDLTVEMIANNCHVSKYYFNRRFKSIVGESVYSFVKRLRLEQSAFVLKTNPLKSVTEIGEKFKYSSSNYSWAFKKHFKVSPVKFRKEMSNYESTYHGNSRVNIELKEFQEYNKKIDIIELEDINIIYKRFIGKYRDSARNWLDVIEKAKDVINNETLFLDLSHDDPTLTNENRCIYDICVSSEKKLEGFSSTIVKGGKYCAYDFIGPNYEIFHAYQGLLSVWVSNSGVTLDNRKIFAIYENFEQKEDCLKMKICLPIK